MYTLLIDYTLNKVILRFKLVIDVIILIRKEVDSNIL